MIFVVSGCSGAVWLLLSLFLPPDRSDDPTLDDDENITLAQFFSIFKEPRLVPVYSVIIINMFLVGILFGFLPVYLHSIGYTSVQSGSILSVASDRYLLVLPLAGQLSDQFEILTTVSARVIL